MSRKHKLRGNKNGRWQEGPTERSKEKKDKSKREGATVRNIIQTGTKKENQRPHERKEEGRNETKSTRDK